MRLRAKVDANHASIIEIARGIGATCIDTSRLGRGVPDAVVIWRGRAYLCEFKVKGGTMTPAEKRFALFCREPVHRIETADQLLGLIGAI